MTTPIEGQAVAFVYVTDRERGLGFYRDTLGFGLRSADPFGDFLDMSGALLRMTAMPDFKPSEHPVLGLDVRDIAAAVDVLRARGVELLIYDGMGQDERGVWTSPDGKAKVAYFKDPDGNVLSLSQT